ncbi:MAG: hypothetical protein AAF550_12305 [Myxococcota bacterium]
MAAAGASLRGAAGARAALSGSMARGGGCRHDTWLTGAAALGAPTGARAALSGSMARGGGCRWGGQLTTGAGAGAGTGGCRCLMTCGAVAADRAC